MTGDGRRKSLVWPLVLIGLGIVFLLNNLGIVSWNIWNVLWRMWPVLVIALGLDMIFGRRSGLWSAITVVFVLVMFAGAYWLVSVSGNIWDAETSVVLIAQELTGADSADVSLKMGVGALDVGAQPEPSDLLIEGEIVLYQFEDYRESAEMEGDQLIYSLSTAGSQFQPGLYIPAVDERNKSWELLLNPEVEMELNVDTGVGKTTLNLVDLDLSSLDIDSGVGEVSIYLPDFPDLDVRVSGGVGKIEVFLPEGINARIQVDTGLGSLNFDGSFDFENGYYFSEDFDGKGPYVDIFLDGGVGNIRVVQLND